MKKLIGFNNLPNDFVNFALRAELSKRYGLFGKIPMWGEVKLHQFYPPLSTIFVRIFGITGTVLLYFASSFLIWMYYQNPLTAILFLISYYHLPQMLYVGRLSEFLGYNFVVLAFYNSDPLLSGVFLGLAGLCYQVPFLAGSMIMLLKFSPITYLSAFCVCGWWYVPFVLNHKKLAFLKESRPDKFMGIYYMQWASMLLVFIFLFGHFWLKVFFGVGIWFLPVIWKFTAIPCDLEIRGYFTYIKSHLAHFMFRKPFFLSDLAVRMPAIEKVTEKTILIEQPSLCPGFLKNEDPFSGSMKMWVWALALYFIEKDIVVYNGLPSTEVPAGNIKIPGDIKVYPAGELGLRIEAAQ